jgi:hypothetical protein
MRAGGRYRNRSARRKQIGRAMQEIPEESAGDDSTTRRWRIYDRSGARRVARTLQPTRSESPW